VAHNWSAIFARLRSLFAIERLEAGAPPAPAPPRAGLLRLLLAPEPLPRDPELPPRRRRAWLRDLLAVEPLDRAPPPPPRARRAGWLRALLAVERIDPP
jgi:hypothetical protein